MFHNRTEAKIAVFDFIEGFYNIRRRHSALGNKSPARFAKPTTKPRPPDNITNESTNPSVELGQLQ